MNPDVSALILAGGKATRFGGIAKHTIEIGGETILARLTRVLSPHVGEILVSSPQEIDGFRTVPDTLSGGGPLAGVAAGLAACATEWMLVVAGDMPYMSEDLVILMLVARAGETDAVGVRCRGLPEPLVCVLHQRVLPVLERRLAAGRFKASGLLTDEGLSVAWIDWPDEVALHNVNAPDDLG